MNVCERAFAQSISIHALREESDLPSTLHVELGEDFNPRSP